MSHVKLPNEVASLLKDQQDAIKKVLVDTGLMMGSGDLGHLGPDILPEKTRAALIGNAGQDFKIKLPGLPNLKCIAARVAEAAAVAPCASVPGGQIAVAACVAAAHAVANEACK